jgi:hypothetical protein
MTTPDITLGPAITEESIVYATTPEPAIAEPVPRSTQS